MPKKLPDQVLTGRTAPRVKIDATCFDRPTTGCTTPFVSTASGQQRLLLRLETSAAFEGAPVVIVVAIGAVCPHDRHQIGGPIVSYHELYAVPA